MLMLPTDSEMSYGGEAPPFQTSYTSYYSVASGDGPPLSPRRANTIGTFAAVSSTAAGAGTPGAAAGAAAAAAAASSIATATTTVAAGELRAELAALQLRLRGEADLLTGLLSSKRPQLQHQQSFLERRQQQQQQQQFFPSSRLAAQIEADNDANHRSKQHSAEKKLTEADGSCSMSILSARTCPGGQPSQQPDGFLGAAASNAQSVPPMPGKLQLQQQQQQQQQDNDKNDGSSDDFRQDDTWDSGPPQGNVQEVELPMLEDISGAGTGASETDVAPSPGKSVETGTLVGAAPVRAASKASQEAGLAAVAARMANFQVEGDSGISSKKASQFANHKQLSFTAESTASSTAATAASVYSGRKPKFLTAATQSVVFDAEEKFALEAAKRASIKEERRSQMAVFMQQPSLQTFVASSRFEIAVAAAVLLNAVLIGIDVEVATHHPGEPSPLYFYVLQHVFTVFFCLELVLRVKAFGFYGTFIQHGINWEWFDLFIVISALVEMTSDILYLAGEGDQPMVSGFSQLRMGRVVKVTRLIRTFRIQRLIRIIAPLRTLVFSIIVTLKSLCWAMCLLLLIIYVVGVVIVQTVTNYRASETAQPEVLNQVRDLFWDLSHTVWTLLQCISGGINWREAGVPLMEISPWIGLVFTFFICFVYFAVLNVVTGVFCSSAIETTQRTPEVIATAMISNKKSYEKNLRQLFEKLDRDGSGLLTLAEMQAFLNDEIMHAQLASLEIDVNDAWQLFRLLDTNKSGVIGLEEFVDGCMSLKGAAKGIDVAVLRKELRSLTRFLHKVQKNGEDVRSSSRSVVSIRDSSTRSPRRQDSNLVPLSEDSSML